MNEADICRVVDWTVERGLAGDSEITLLHGFCDLCAEAGLEISRGIAIIDTLHPVYEGRVFYWSRDERLDRLVSEYEPTTGGQDKSNWLSSPFYHLLQSGEDEMRRRLYLGETEQIPGAGGTAAGGPDRLVCHGAAVRQGGGHRRDGLLHVALDDDPAGRFSRR